MKRARVFLVATVVVTGLAAGCAGGDGDLGTNPTATPNPGDNEVRGPAYLEESELLIMESDPIQLAVRLKGNMPTPCHQLRWRVSGPEDGELAVEVYSTIPLGLDCIQVLEPFEETIQLGSVEGGSYTVTINGDELGTVDA